MKESGEEQTKSTELNNGDKTKKTVKKSVLWGCIAAACLVVVFVCGWSLGKAQGEQQRQEELAALAAEVAAMPESTPTPQPTATPEPTVVQKGGEQAEPTPLPRRQNERNVGFDRLLEENPDVIGWLEVGGTTIDYPLLSSLINDYYLTHDFYREESAYGAIYIDIRNNADLNDPFTVIYGHNMKDGSMFADLHKFEEEDFFYEHGQIRIYTPEGQLNYEVFAAFKRDDAHLLGNQDFKKAAVKRKHLDEIRALEGTEDAYIDMDDVTVDDTIVALSTCVTGEGENRYVVYAKFIPPEEG
ncbi:class B sortase [Christensenellaceae bacterium OttesenSCG-928-K19]|nr:class B sortase [Christensenellaceae bacterium OttesenSCG-928-K19]